METGASDILTHTVWGLAWLGEAEDMGGAHGAGGGPTADRKGPG